MSMKVEIFHKNEASELQGPINEWLEKHPKIHVDYITQSQVHHRHSGHMPMTVCIWYTEGG